MTDANALLGSVMTFASFMAGLSIAVERAVEIAKGAVPFLANPWAKNDRVRAAILQLIAAILGAAIASQMPNQVKSVMPPGLAVPLNWPTYAVLGLMTCAGAGVWNHLFDILAAMKTKQETLASLVQTTGVGATGAAPLTTPLSGATAVSGVASAAGTAVASAATPVPVAKPAVAGMGFAGASSRQLGAPAAAAGADLAVAARDMVSIARSGPLTPASNATPSGVPTATNAGPAGTDAARSAASIYPGRVISVDDTDARTIRLIQHRLNQVGCGPIVEDGVFGQKTKAAVELYQIRSADHFGLPLQVDGAVGPLTWYSLFAMPEIPATWHSSFTPETSTIEMAPSPLLAATLQFAAGEVGVMEDPLGSNRGPRVDQYLRSVEIDPTTGSYPWCAAFVYFCFQQAANLLGVRNPVVKTAEVLDHWNKAGLAGIKRLDTEACVANPSLVTPGMIFVIIYPSGAGHTGLVDKVSGDFLRTIEGNTNNNGSREGIGVFRRNQRTIASINRGFICYS